MFNMKMLMTQAAIFAEQLAMKVRKAQNQFRTGTTARRHMNVHDRASGPNSRTSIHMLVRSVNAGYVCELQDNIHWGSIGRSLRPQ